MDLDPPRGESAKPAALQLELPSAPARPSNVAPPATSRPPWESLPAPKRRTVAWILGLFGVLVVAATVLAAIALPEYIRRACIAEAAQHGIALTVTSVKVSRMGLLLSGVKATAAAIPGASAEAAEMQVQLDGLRPEKIVATSMTATAEGRYGDLAAAFSQWRASEQGGQAGAWAPASLVADQSHVVWRGAMGDGSRIEASGVHFDVTWSAHDPVVHATSSAVSFALPSGTFGPWRLDLDQEPGASRLRVALDPGVPDACTILIVTNGETVTSAEVTIPRSPVARLGVPATRLGLSGDIQLEMRASYALLGDQVNATAKGALHGIAVSPLPRAIDITWDLSAKGDRRGAIDLRSGRIAVGPLVGPASGTLRTFDDGFRVDLGWHANPVPCAALGASLAPDQPFDVAYQLQRLAQSSGLARVQGNVSANATMTFDSRELGASSVRLSPKVDCSVALEAP